MASTAFDPGAFANGTFAVFVDNPTSNTEPPAPTPVTGTVFLKSDDNKKDYLYSDFKMDLDEHPLTGDVAVDVNVNAVKRAVRNLLLTGMYERRFRPYIGSGLQKYLFENVTPTTAQLIRESIITTITNFEPRAKLVAVRVQADPDYNYYSATVKFSVKNIPDVVVLDEIIRRVR